MNKNKKIVVPGILTNKKIAVLCGGVSQERGISLKTGNAIYKSIKSLGLKVTKIDIKNDAIRKLSARKIDIAFIALHGEYGEDGVMQGLLELAGIPYTGSGVLSSALAMDKIFTKKIFVYHNLPVAEYEIVKKDNRKNFLLRLKLPVVVKPSKQGSSIGVSIVRETKALKRAIDVAFKYSEEILIEKYIRGRELSVGILDRMALPVVEIIPAGTRGFYDLKAKYDEGGSIHVIPAGISKIQYKKAQELALTTHNIFGCKGVTRTDMILNKSGKLYVLEINTIPGMTMTSLVPEAAEAAGISFSQLVLKILASALKSENSKKK